MNDLKRNALKHLIRKSTIWLWKQIILHLPHLKKENRIVTTKENK